MSRAGCPRIVPDPTISTDGYRELAVFQLIHHSRGGAARRVPWPHVFRCRPIICSLSVEVIVVTSPGGARAGRERRLASGLPAHDEILRVSPASPVGGTYLYAGELRCSVARSRSYDRPVFAIMGTTSKQMGENKDAFSISFVQGMCRRSFPVCQLGCIRVRCRIQQAGRPVRKLKRSKYG